MEKSHPSSMWPPVSLHLRLLRLSARPGTSRTAREWALLTRVCPRAAAPRAQLPLPFWLTTGTHPRTLRAIYSRHITTTQLSAPGPYFDSTDSKTRGILGKQKLGNSFCELALNDFHACFPIWPLPRWSLPVGFGRNTVYFHAMSSTSRH